ncbi:glycosyltransferase family A protein [Chitinophaga sp.]|uniref:glycosyltransferase family 2 protein n=1 Tax=Chitinophaga sp. TaxID=1869181 RepID=UPI002F93D5E8
MQNRISCCTVCMNRTIHLKQTLKRNIHDNAGYHNIEFVILDYGSRDDLYDWVQTELQQEIDTGLVVYFRTTDPQFFHMSHSKNMAFRLATGDILCSIDADNFIGPGFAEYVNEQFNKDPDIFLMPPRIGTHKKYWDVQGRICVKRDDFYKLRGYDEKVMDYGYEDQDFKGRLEVYGRKSVVIKNPEFLDAITHDDSMRIADGFSTKKTKEVLISVASDELTEIIYLEENNVFETFYVPNDSLASGKLNDCVLHPKKRYAGAYRHDGQAIQLYKENGTLFQTLMYKSKDQLISDDHRHFNRINSDLLRENFLLKRAIYVGKRIFSQNKIKGGMINENGFGQGTVYQNFSAIKIHLGEEVTAGRI